MEWVWVWVSNFAGGQIGYPYPHLGRSMGTGNPWVTCSGWHCEYLLGMGVGWLLCHVWLTHTQFAGFRYITRTRVGTHHYPHVFSKLDLHCSYVDSTQWSPTPSPHSALAQDMFGVAQLQTIQMSNFKMRKKKWSVTTLPQQWLQWSQPSPA